MEDIERRPVSVKESYEALSQEGFAVWIRLHTVPTKALSKGRAGLAKICQYSVVRLNCIFRELRLAEYIRVHAPPHPGAVARVELLKRLKISRQSQFVRLSSGLHAGLADHGELDLPLDGRPVSYLHSSHEEMGLSSQERGLKNNRFGSSKQGGLARKNSAEMGKSADTCEPTPNDGPDWDLPKSWCLPEVEKVVWQKTSILPLSLHESLASQLLDGNEANGQTGKPKPKRIKFIGPTGTLKLVSETDLDSDTIPHYIEDSLDPSSSLSEDLSTRPKGEVPACKSGVDLSKLPDKETRRKKAKEAIAARPKAPGIGQPIEWAAIERDLNGQPLVTFSPTDKRREEIVRLVTSNARRMTPANRKERKQVITKLTRQFTRMYTTYRRLAQREAGQLGDYAVMEQERKYAESAALACIVKGVTPTRVFEYWHVNIKTFANKGMSVPPLTFLSQPANIDTVAIAGVGASAAPPAAARGSHRPLSDHSYSDTSLLHPGLRAALTDAGFDLTDTNNKYLVGVQASAIDYVTFGKGSLPPHSIRKMVYWAAEHIYGHMTEDQLDSYL